MDTHLDTTTKPPHTTSELFICFTSLLSHSHSSSSTAPTTLTTSLSRRLRHNRSLRCGPHSPAMFPSSKKSRPSSSAFSDNPEPSSPKVTCIGQVRVKTKQHRHKIKMRACRRNLTRPGSEPSFRRIDTGSDTLTPQLSIASNNKDCSLQQRNQRWVHLPLTICEALRTFGNEFSCLLPCKSSCFSSNSSNDNEGQKRENGGESNGGSSCGAVFRWLVSLQEGEEGKRRDIELVVGDDVEERERVMERECSRRRSIFDDMEFDDLFKDVGNDVVVNDNDNEKGRVSVCVPPKNALLLMRCRSDPVKLASLSRKLWEPSVLVDGGEDDEVVVEKVEVKEGRNVEFDERLDMEKEEISEESVELGQGIDGMCEDLGVAVTNVEDLGVCDEEQVQEDEEEVAQKVEEVQENVEQTEEKLGFENREELELVQEQEECVIFGETQMIEDEILAIEAEIDLVSAEGKCQDVEIHQHLVNNDSCSREENLECAENEQDLGSKSCSLEEKFEDAEYEQDLASKSCRQEENFQDAQYEQDMVNNSCNQEIQMQGEELERVESSELSSSSSITSSDESQVEEVHEQENDTVEDVKVARKSMEKTQENESEFEKKEQVYESKCEEKKQEYESKCEEKKQEKTNNKPMLPDCLLLMMCEPKLSMEVSKETWVCSTDFVQWLPDRHQTKKLTKTDCSDDKKKVAAVAPVAAHLPPQPPAPQPAYQPGRSSISFPAGGVGNLIEQKLVKAGVGYEPFALTRCKSAPHRSTAKISGPELACSLWGRENGRKLEPHRQATCGVGTAGVGF